MKEVIRNRITISFNPTGIIKLPQATESLQREYGLRNLPRNENQHPIAISKALE
jgi:hypothetical protein